MNITVKSRRVFAAMIWIMDEQISKVLDAIENRSMLDNTLLVYMSDKGGGEGPGQQLAVAWAQGAWLRGRSPGPRIRVGWCR